MKRNQGFTLIELVIVIAIIAIIATIAIPNLLRSRISANEAIAVTTIKNYATAQVTFQLKAKGLWDGNNATYEDGYCLNFRNLFYGVLPNDPDHNLALISKSHADAFIFQTVLTGTNMHPISPPLMPTPLQGYQFREPYDAREEYFATQFAQLAVPATSGSTGSNAYWLGIEGTVYRRVLPAGLEATAHNTTMATPASGNFSGWSPLS